MNEHVQQASELPYHMIQLDRSKPFSTIHGERLPDDPLFNVCYMQNGLPFDANDRLVPDDGRTAPWQSVDVDRKPCTHSPLYNPTTRSVVMRRLERLQRSMGNRQATPDLAEIPDGTDLVNLGLYLKGGAEYTDKQIIDAVYTNYQRRCSNGPGAIHWLLYELSPPLIPAGSAHPSRIDRIKHLLG